MKLAHLEDVNIVSLLLSTPLEFFTSVLADGFTLEFEWLSLLLLLLLLVGVVIVVVVVLVVFTH